MGIIEPGIVVCICTYKRPHLLKQELADLLAQTVLPERWVIVNGDPTSPDVLEMLKTLPFPPDSRVIYIASNHSNLSFQRYLGWRAARDGRILVYFDDDLRIPQLDAFERVIAPLQSLASEDVVGVTALTNTRGWDHFDDPDIVRTSNRAPRILVRLLGASGSITPGGLSSVGHRIYPKVTGEDFAEVQWLQGRLMAYRLVAVTQDCFSEDLFALDEIRCGLGEDTFLSRQIGSKGRLLLSMNTHFIHPDEDTPKSYPFKAYKLAYARAYSRRFLNDHYRVNKPPRFVDRFNLVKSYAANCVLNVGKLLISPHRNHAAYAWGYARGMWRGLTQKPTAKELTPGVDWWGDAERALAQQTCINENT
ncbi:MAG: glycosyltransferase [Anaerolineae bacterium]